MNEPFSIALGDILPYFEFSATSDLEVSIISFFHCERPFVIPVIFAIKKVLKSDQTFGEFVCFQLDYLVTICLRHFRLQLVHKFPELLNKHSYCSVLKL